MPTACTGCKEDLAGKEFVEQDASKYCIPCYEDKFCGTCAACEKKIKIDDKGMVVKDKDYHEECFICAGCKTTLAGKQFLRKGDEVYCLKCQNIDENQKCELCDKDFQPGDKKCISGGKFFHNACFICSKCDQQIGQAEYFNIDGKFVCDTCHSKDLKLCRSCEKPVNGGVVYKAYVYHENCFVCGKCAVQVGGDIKFLSADGDRPFCIDCFSADFADRCASCDKAVTGKFMKTDSASYHRECFNCANCQTSLCDGNFYKTGGQLMCEKCSKAG